MKWYYLAIMFPLLTACTKTVYVKVPTPVPCPEPPKIEKVELPISKLSENDKYSEIAAAYAKSIIILKEQNEQLIKILDGYRK